MSYKDKDKQREAVMLATRRYRAKKQVSAIPAQKQGFENARECVRMDERSDTRPVIPVIPSAPKAVIPKKISKQIRRHLKHPAFEGPVIEPEPDVLRAKINNKTVFNMGEPSVPSEPRPQSYNPMMVGYVPPQE